jgi:hypothetical protein
MNEPFNNIGSPNLIFIKDQCRLSQELKIYVDTHLGLYCKGDWVFINLSSMNKSLYPSFIHQTPAMVTTDDIVMSGIDVLIHVKSYQEFNCDSFELGSGTNHNTSQLKKFW